MKSVFRSHDERRKARPRAHTGGADQRGISHAKVVRRSESDSDKHGQETAANRGLILVDTKYEFGTDERGDLVLIDEIHTPDSSRYWQLASYAERMKAGQEPEYFDKEFLRLWFKEHSDPYKDGKASRSARRHG